MASCPAGVFRHIALPSCMGRCRCQCSECSGWEFGPIIPIALAGRCRGPRRQSLARYQRRMEAGAFAGYHYKHERYSVAFARRHQRLGASGGATGGNVTPYISFGCLSRMYLSALAAVSLVERKFHATALRVTRQHRPLAVFQCIGQLRCPAGVCLAGGDDPAERALVRWYRRVLPAPDWRRSGKPDCLSTWRPQSVDRWSRSWICMVIKETSSWLIRTRQKPTGSRKLFLE